MKLKVEVQYRDRITKELMKVDDVFEVDEERGKELLSHPLGLVSEVKETKKRKR